MFKFTAHKYDSASAVKFTFITQPNLICYCSSRGCEWTPITRCVVAEVKYHGSNQQTRKMDILYEKKNKKK